MRTFYTIYLSFRNGLRRQIHRWLGLPFTRTLTLCFDDLLAIKRFRKVCYDQMRAAVRRPKPRSRNTQSHRRLILQRQHGIVFVLKMLLTTPCAAKPRNGIFSTILVDFSIRFAIRVRLPAGRNSRSSSTWPFWARWRENASTNTTLMCHC